MPDATVTLPDGRLGVVHCETIGWDDPASADGATFRELAATACENFAVRAAEPHTRCPTVRAAAPQLTVTREGQRRLWFDASVLCLEPACRAETEAYEAEIGGEYPDASRLREWAQGAGAVRP
ncbi:hypothetical protein ACIRPQ_29135 [Streptomyces sp. NPDC101213]|uniref:hypothetical protein n=1 Tax=Streptomyces sp. NPDC101213 TaxID=3366130 RepID=UPI0038293ECE